MTHVVLQPGDIALQLGDVSFNVLKKCGSSPLSRNAANARVCVRALPGVRVDRRQRLPLRVILHREDDRLVVEPVKRKRTLAEILPQLEPIAEEFPEIPDPPVRSEDVFRP